MITHFGPWNSEEDDEYDPEEVEEEEGDKLFTDENCSSCRHSYVFEEMIPTQEFGRYQERWYCMFCNHEMTLTFNLGGHD